MDDFSPPKTCLTTRTENSYWYIDFDKMAIVVESFYKVEVLNLQKLQ